MLRPMVRPVVHMCFRRRDLAGARERRDDAQEVHTMLPRKHTWHGDYLHLLRPGMWQAHVQHSMLACGKI